MTDLEEAAERLDRPGLLMEAVEWPEGPGHTSDPTDPLFHWDYEMAVDPPVGKEA